MECIMVARLRSISLQRAPSHMYFFHEHGIERIMAVSLDASHPYL